MSAMPLPVWADALVALLLLVGAMFALLGSIGLARFHDFYKRLHGPTKATTLGVGGVLLASALHFSMTAAGVSVHEFLITLFLLLTAPVSAHMLVKAALAHARRTDDVRETSPEDARDSGRSGAGG
jgi:multicomponent K+:H+ antiporter subunit G